MPVWPRTRLTIGIQRRLTKAFRRWTDPTFRCGTAFCRHRKSGLPSTPPNHKSDGGSLQSWNRPPPQLPATGSDERRLLSLHAKRVQVIATNFAGVLPWRGNRLREENGRVCSRAGSVRANKLVRLCRALVQKVYRLRWLRAQSWKGPHQTAPIWLRAVPPWRSGSDRRTFKYPAPTLHARSSRPCLADCG